MVQREQNLQAINPFIDKDLIKVIVGVRRSGKSTLLLQIQNILKGRDVLEENILSINYESKHFDKLRDAGSLYEYVTKWHAGRKGKVYLFFDEIQEVQNWEMAINSFRVDFPCDIYISGSNSKLLSGELATNLRGRYVTLTVYPFTFRETVEFQRQQGSNATKEAMFADYLQYGGFPQRLTLQDEHAVQTYLSDLYDTIVLKDIAERNKIKNFDLLRKLMEFLVNNIGNIFSANSIVKKLASEGVKTSVDTILSYVDSMCHSFAIYKVPRYNLAGKQLLESSEKYYCVDPGFRTLLSRGGRQDIGHIYENIVYMELLSRGWKVMVGKMNQGEIDFVCTKYDKTIYIQVAYLIGESDVEREFGNLELIHDNFPKYVISSDPVDLSRNGIIHKNIVDFLLEKE